MAQDSKTTARQILDALNVKGYENLTPEERNIYQISLDMYSSDAQDLFNAQEKQDIKKRFDDLIQSKNQIVNSIVSASPTKTAQPIQTAQGAQTSIQPYKFNQADYDKWLRANGYANATSPKDREFARRKYIEDVLMEQYGTDKDVFTAAVQEFTEKKPVKQEYLDEISVAISPSLPVENQVVDSSLGQMSDESKASPTEASATSQIDNVLERIRNLRTQSAADKAIADVNKSKAATAMTLGAGALKGLTGLGQYLGGRKELRGLEMPKEPVYQPNQAIDTELARLQVLAQSGDPLIREQAMRDIATRQAIAEQAYRVGSGGDVSAFGAGVAGANIAGMNAARQLAADENQRKMQYGSQLAGLIGQQTQDRQFKQQADYNNFLAAVKEYERKGDRAAGQMDAGISNIATGVQDLRLAGVERIGSKAAMDKLLSDFKAMTPEMQQQMIAKYPKLFGQFAETKNSANTQGMRVLPIGLAATGFPIPIKSINFSVK
jgi:hypothetical protein